MVTTSFDAVKVIRIIEQELNAEQVALNKLNLIELHCIWIPLDKNGSHVGNFRICVLIILYV